MGGVPVVRFLDGDGVPQLVGYGDLDHVTGFGTTLMSDGGAYASLRTGSGLAAGAPLLQTRLIPVQAGGRVTVYHDPRRPQRAYVLRPGWPGMAFLLALATVPVALYALHYHG